MRKIWFDEAWDDYVYWQSQDKKTLKRINNLIKDAERSPFEGRDFTKNAYMPKGKETCHNFHREGAF